MIRLQLFVFSLTLLLMGACAHQNGNVGKAEQTTPQASGPPNTDIYIADLVFEGNTPRIDEVRPLVTTEGYDNQPAFLPDGKHLLYASEGPSGKTDIWRYNLDKNLQIRVTDTPEKSEYSPRLMPDNQAISFIQETPAGDITEIYSKSLIDGTSGPIISLKPLGYYAFLNQGADVLVFLRSEPASLQSVNVATGNVNEVASNIGRALYAPTGEKTAFFTTVKADTSPDNTVFMVNQYSIETEQIKPLFALPGTSQDYVVFPVENENYGFLSADGSALYYRTDNPADSWQKVADLSEAGLSITRLAVNTDLSRVALVTSG